MNETKLFEDDTYAVCEVMGHNTFAGKVSQHVIGGTAFIRVDVPAIPERKTVSYGHETTYPEVPAFTKLIGAGSIYAITPCSEEVALRMAAAKRQVPVEVLDVSISQRRIAAPVREDTDFDPDDSDDDDGVPI